MVRMPDFCQCCRISLESICPHGAVGVVQVPFIFHFIWGVPVAHLTIVLRLVWLNVGVFLAKLLLDCDLWTSYFAVEGASVSAEWVHPIRSSGFPFLASCRDFDHLGLFPRHRAVK